jgi:HK97 family phage major capsid protein
MKKLREARASNLRKAAYGILTFCLIIALGTVLNSIESISQLGTIGGASLAFTPLLAMRRFNAGEGAQATTATKDEVLATVKTEASKTAKAEALAAYEQFIADNPEIKELKTIKLALEQKTSKEDLEAIKKMCEEVGLAVKGLSETPRGTNDKPVTLRQALTKAFEAKDVKEEIAKIVASGGRQQGRLEITVKEAITMGVQNTIGAGDTQHSITENTGIISTIRRRETSYLANVSVGSISTDRAFWMEEKDEQGTPIMLGEGDSKTQLSVRYEEAEMRVRKIAVYGKVTTEMLADLPQLISYIENNLMRRMDIVVENQLFSGDNTGNNLKGLLSYATAFDGGGLSGVDVANEYDVIEALALQVSLAFGSANAIFVHPRDFASMKLLKDTAGNYIYPRWATADGLSVAGVRVIPTTAITAGTFVGGDLSVVNVLNRDSLSLTVGLDGNDFTQNKKTMLCERRLVQFVSANDTALIVKGNWTGAKSDISTPS